MKEKKKNDERRAIEFFILSYLFIIFGGTRSLYQDKRENLREISDNYHRPRYIGGLEISLHYVSWTKLARADYGKWAHSYRPSYRVFVARFSPLFALSLSLSFPLNRPFHIQTIASLRESFRRCRREHADRMEQYRML